MFFCNNPDGSVQVQIYANMFRYLPYFSTQHAFSVILTVYEHVYSETSIRMILHVKDHLQQISHCLHYVISLETMLLF